MFFSDKHISLRSHRGAGRGQDDDIRSHTLMEGWLEKQSERWKSWNVRYFVLTHTRLHYFSKKGGDTTVYGTEKASFPLSLLTISINTHVSTAEDRKQQQQPQPAVFHIVCQHPNKMLTIRAESSKEMTLWVQSIEEAKRKLIEGLSDTCPGPSFHRSFGWSDRILIVSVKSPSSSSSCSSSLSSPSIDASGVLQPLPQPLQQQPPPTTTTSATTSASSSSPSSLPTVMEERVVARCPRYDQTINVGTVPDGGSVVVTFADGGTATIDASALKLQEQGAEDVFKVVDSYLDSSLRVSWRPQPSTALPVTPPVPPLAALGEAGVAWLALLLLPFALLSSSSWSVWSDGQALVLSLLALVSWGMAARRGVRILRSLLRYHQQQDQLQRLNLATPPPTYALTFRSLHVAPRAAPAAASAAYLAQEEKQMAAAAAAASAAAAGSPTRRAGLMGFVTGLFRRKPKEDATKAADSAAAGGGLKKTGSHPELSSLSAAAGTAESKHAGSLPHSPSPVERDIEMIPASEFGSSSSSSSSIASPVFADDEADEGLPVAARPRRSPPSSSSRTSASSDSEALSSPSLPSSASFSSGSVSGSGLALHLSTPIAACLSHSPFLQPVSFGMPARRESWGAWGEGDWRPLVVRGASYMQDKRKVPAGPFMMKLLHVELFRSDQRMHNVAGHPQGYLTRFHAHYRTHLRQLPAYADPATPLPPPPFVFALNFLIPGDPPHNLVGYFIRDAPETKTTGSTSTTTTVATATTQAAPAPASGATSPPPATAFSASSSSSSSSMSDPAFEATLRRFLSGDEPYRHVRVKLIPRIVEGSWLVKKGVGSQPAVLGKKLAQSYVRNTELNYFEVDVDVGSSRVANSVLKLVKGFATSLVIDLALLIEGQLPDELPERLLGGLRICHIDMNKTLPFGQHLQSNLPLLQSY